MPDRADRRSQSDRLPTVFRVEIDAGGGKRFPGVAVNLSGSGACIHLNEELRPGQEVGLDLWPADAAEPIRLAGRVRWIEEFSPILRTTFAFEAGLGLDRVPAEFERFFCRENDRFVDYRMHTRSSTRLRVRVSGPGLWETTFAPNLSRRGLFVRTDGLLEPGQFVEVELFLPDAGQPVLARGEVVHTIDAVRAAAIGTEPGLGLRITVPSAVDKARFQKYVDDLERRVER
jgi:Tfp pilus assembly protein PilZ